MKLIAPLPRDAHCECALPAVSRPPARQTLIEGSWQRLDADRPQPAAARRSRPPILLWGALTIAGLALGGSVYAYGGLETWMTAHAAVADGPAEPLIQAAAEDVDAIPIPAPASPPALIERSTANGMTSDGPASQVPSWPAESALVAAVPRSESADPIPGPTATGRDAHVEAPLQARLPRPRPEPPTAFASIERRWEEIRALRNRAGYPARPRFFYRYRVPPL